jgi:hypothetical protein
MKYKIYLNQYVTAQVRVEFEIESDLTLEDLQDEIYETTEDWSRLARFSPELEEFPGTYVKDSYKYDLDYQGDDGDEIDVYVEEVEQTEEN